jgi:hypothetical protein
MIDRTHSGARCSVLHSLRTVAGALPRGTHGTVVYEMDNLDRHLMLVQWDTGILIPVFPREITFGDELTMAGQ